MAEINYFYPQGHEQHYQPGHPERPERVEAMVSTLRDEGLWERGYQVEPLEIDHGQLARIHNQEMLSRVEEAGTRGEALDLDTYTTPHSWRLACQAAGGGAAAARRVWRGDDQKGFALTRPPGHHATRTQPMGFCLLNNVAIAADFLIQEENAAKVAILDIDLHHGNGTQDIFYQREEVFYFSTHQYPHYPGTGRLTETGSGPGEGTNANLPLPPQSGVKAFQAAIQEGFLPLMDRFRPGIILVSYGFDAHWRDPLGSLILTAEEYGNIIQSIVNWAERNCQGKVVLFLEGGYDISAARFCTLNVVSALLKETCQDPIGSSPVQEGTAWQKVHSDFKAIWSL